MEIAKRLTIEYEYNEFKFTHLFKLEIRKKFLF